MAEYLAADTVDAVWGGEENYIEPGYILAGYFFDPDAVNWVGVEENG